MADSPEAQQAADQITARLMADPVLGPLLQRQAAGLPFDSYAADARLKQLGIELPKGMWISGGKIQHENMTVDNIGKALKIGLPIAIGASALGAFGSGSSIPGVGGASEPFMGPINEVAKDTITKGPSLLHSLLPTIIGAGASLGGAAIGSKGISDAAKIQAESADKALQVQKEQYALQRQDTAPYRALGQGAVGNLGYLSGIDTQSKVPELSQTVPNVPYGQTAAPTSPLGTLGQMAPAAPAQSPQAGMVRVKAPSGQVGLIPQARLQDALAGGMQQV